MTETRLLTVQQPWATAIVDGKKDVENRGPRFGIGYRGPLWIHAGREWSDDGFRSDLIHEAYPTAVDVGFRGLGFYLGAVIGRVDVVDAHRFEPGCCPSPWANPFAGTHLVLEEATKVPGHGPVVPGALGLWRSSRVGGLTRHLDEILEQTADQRDPHRITLDDSAGIYASTWPDLCSHPSSTGDRCDSCRIEVR